MTFPQLLTMPPANTLEQVSEAQYTRYAELIYARTGVRISPQKKALLSNRLRRRLRATGTAGFDEYYRHLQQIAPSDREWDAFLQEITTHETYLFRDPNHWEWFRSVYLPARAAAAKLGNDFQLRIWSAACSTGDEAFTAACCVAACIPEFTRWKIRILGTDIGIGAVEQARAGQFGERAMRLVPEPYRRSYFTKIKEAERWQANPILTAMAAFRQHNLLDPLNEKPFDLVFLKNVLIYFDRASRKKVMEQVQRMIRPGGYLVAGAAEGISDLAAGLVRVQPWLYQRAKT